MEVHYVSGEVLSVPPLSANALPADEPEVQAFRDPSGIGDLLEVIDGGYRWIVDLAPDASRYPVPPAFPEGYLDRKDALKIEKAFQTISVRSPTPPSAAYGSRFEAAATATSGLATTITTSGVCTGSGSGSATIAMTGGTGRCTVRYSQAGDNDYYAAPEATSEIAAVKANQTVTPTAAYGSTFDVAAGTSSGLPATVTASGACTGGGIGAAKISMISGAGTCTLRFTQDGDADYNAAPEVTHEILATRVDQRIEVTAPAPETAPYASTFEVAATASSNLAVGIAAEGVCTGGGSGTAKITVTGGVGTCTLRFDQPGDTDFLAASEVTETVSAEKARLRVSPKAATRQYGDGSPPLVPEYAGFAPGEGVGDLAREPECSSTAEAASPPGEYPIVCSGGSASNYDFSFDNNAMLTITPEDASIVFSADNPPAAKTNAGRKYSRRLSLTVNVAERQPDSASAGASPGDIDTADLAVTLTPLSGGRPIPLACEAAGVSGSGYSAVKTFKCSNRSSLPADVYDVTAQAGGNYSGVAYDSLSVYGPGLRFANGGGSFDWPGTEEKTNFGFIAKEGKGNAGPRGVLLVVRHHPDGTVSRLKSDTMTGLALQDEASSGCGNATFSGKATYTAWDPSANSGLGGYIDTNNNQFMAYAEDCNNPGSGTDAFLVRGVGAIQMPREVYSSKVSVSGDNGDIVVPHSAVKKK